MYKAYGAQQVQESLLQRDILEQSAARGNAAAQVYVAANPQLGIPLQSGPQQSQAAINGGDTTPITNLTTISSSGKQTVYDYGIGVCRPTA